jgi:hypothetical protein
VCPNARLPEANLKHVPPEPKHAHFPTSGQVHQPHCDLSSHPTPICFNNRPQSKSAIPPPLSVPEQQQRLQRPS